MGTGIRIKVSLYEDVAHVRSIIRHPMETGFNFDEGTGSFIPAHYIREVSCKHNDKVVMQCDWSRAVSKNPYLAFKFSGAKVGDRVSISWKDTENKSDAATVVIK